MTDPQLQRRFEALLREHQRIVLKISSVYARTPADRHDLAQEICTQLWRAFPRYDEQRRFSTWMYRVALNVGISFARSERARDLRVELQGDADDTSHDPPEPDERLRLLHAVIADLDPLQRALAVLYLEERSYADIAAILGLSETNVATKINRLKQRLRDHFAAPGA